MYANLEDVTARLTRQLSESESAAAAAYLEDAAALIDSVAPEALPSAKKTVSCRMVVRAMSSQDPYVPIGATQGSMGGLGYTQSWTVGSGSVGQIYLDKTDKTILGVGKSHIVAHSVLEDLHDRHHSNAL